MAFEVTKVSIYKIDGNDKLKGFARIVVDDCFVVDGLRIIDGSKGLFIGMPSTKGKNGKYRDIFFPINSEVRKSLTDAILSEYEKDDSDDDPFES